MAPLISDQFSMKEPFFIHLYDLKHMRFNHLIVEIQDKIAWISINQPKKLNALNREVLEN